MRMSDWSSDVCSSDLAMEATPLAKLKEKLVRLSHVAVERIPPDWHAWLGLSTADAETAWAVAREEEGSAVPADDFDAREVAALIFAGHLDRKSVVLGKSVSVRVDLGGSRIIKKEKNM